MKTHFFNLIDICFNCFDCDPLNLFIDLLFNSSQFFRSYGGSGVRSQSEGITYFVERSCLGCMVTKDIEGRPHRMEQVSRSVVLHDTMTTIGIDRQGILGSGAREQNFNSIVVVHLVLLNICPGATTCSMRLTMVATCPPISA